MADFLDFLLASPAKSPPPIEITDTTTLEDIIAATIQPEVTNSDSPTKPDSDSDDEALAAAILAEAPTDDTEEPATETRLAESLDLLLGPPPPETSLITELKAELKQQSVPETLFSLLKPKLSIFSREQQLQHQFSLLESLNSTEVNQLSSFFKYQSAVIETERYQALHQAATKPNLKRSINAHYDNQLHKVIDRVEVIIQ